MKLRWTRRARDDLAEIALFIARDKSGAALAWVETLEERAARIPDAPLRYRVVPEFGRDEIREMVTGNYRTVFKVESERIVVLTVFEGHKMLDLDPDTDLGSDAGE
ncbi:MAG: type II toxin-antitoxin system RelE/ParE family toxin [Planctomycetes bacterium]|nr:type II toxin-antitoxin system RelE/ParE family toxin [Planctomycetota bacterium]